MYFIEKMAQIIGITGKKNSGKDTIGNYLVEKYGYKRLAFADPLKEACRSIFSFTDAQLYHDKKEEIDEYWNESPRKIFQIIGTDLLRNKFMKNIWIAALKKKIMDEFKKNPNQKIVITDIRFENENNLIKELNGIIIRVNRYTSNINVDLHESEQMIDNLVVDYEINNNSTKEILFDCVEKLVFPP
jgi:dephospho-CoA kinase